jgi:DNA-binding MarR family transcriptional regulator/GNAT superfamily N-acetyltransferase
MQQSSLANDISSFRQFNRMYTRLLGTLDEGLLKSRFSLAEARILFELATRQTPRAKEIADELDMDPGYLSRLLAGFEKSGLLNRRISEADSRVAELHLTRRGQAEFKKINARSQEQAHAILHSLTPSQRSKLVHSMHSIQSVFTRPEQSKVVLRPPRVGDMGWVIHREGAVYAEEYGWDEAFEALVARIVTDFTANFDSNRERCWMADVNGENLGHIFLVKHPEEPGTAKLRLLLVEPAARGMGIGGTLVSECLQFAREAGYKKVVLWTQSILVSARRLYERAGFQLVYEEPGRRFGKDLVAQNWELKLD